MVDLLHIHIEIMKCFHRHLPMPKQLLPATLTYISTSRNQVLVIFIENRMFYSGIYLDTLKISTLKFFKGGKVFRLSFQIAMSLVPCACYYGQAYSEGTWTMAHRVSSVLGDVETEGCKFTLCTSIILSLESE